ncbi:MAG: hypothetical protein RR986_05405 [Longicatena sp.]
MQIIVYGETWNEDNKIEIEYNNTIHGKNTLNIRSIRKTMNVIMDYAVQNDSICK